MLSENKISMSPISFADFKQVNRKEIYKRKLKYFDLFTSTIFSLTLLHLLLPQHTNVTSPIFFATLYISVSRPSYSFIPYEINNTFIY